MMMIGDEGSVVVVSICGAHVSSMGHVSVEVRPLYAFSSCTFPSNAHLLSCQKTSESAAICVLGRVVRSFLELVLCFK
jgi:hypothetical protein